MDETKTHQKPFNEKLVFSLFLAALILFLLPRLLCETCVIALAESSLLDTALQGAKALSALLSVVVIILNFVHRRYSGRAFLCFFLLFCALIITALCSGNLTFCWYFLLFASAYKQNSKDVISFTCIFTGIFLVLVVLASFLGVGAENPQQCKTLGFSWTTTGPILFFFWCVQYIFLRKDLIKIWELLILELINVYFYFALDALMTFCVLTLLLVILAIEQCFKHHWKIAGKIGRVFAIAPLVFCLAAITFFALYNSDSASWQAIDGITHGRMELAKSGIATYGITLCGQEIEWIGFSVNLVEGVYNYVDSSYLQILLEFGILGLAAIIAIYTNLMYRAAETKNFYFVFAVLAILLQSVTEPQLMNMSLNIIPLIAFMTLDPEPLRVATLFRR